MLSLRSWSQTPCLNDFANEENSSQVDVQFHGVSQHDIYLNEESMTRMQNLVDRLRDGFRDKSIIIKDSKQCVQRGIKAQEQRDEQHWAVQTKRNKQNNWLSYLLEVFQRRHNLRQIQKNSIHSQEHEDKNRKRTDIFAELLYVVKRGRHGQLLDMISGKTTTG